MGLGRSPVSLPSQLARNGVIEDTFSMCYGGHDGGGAMLMGRVPHSVSLNYTSMDIDPVHPYYYNVVIEGMRLGTKQLYVRGREPGGQWMAGGWRLHVMLVGGCMACDKATDIVTSARAYCRLEPRTNS